MENNPKEEKEPNSKSRNMENNPKDEKEPNSESEEVDEISCSILEWTSDGSRLIRRRSSMPRFIDCKIRNRKKDSKSFYLPPESHDYNLIDDILACPPKSMPNNLKRVLLYENVTEERLLQIRLSDLAQQKNKTAMNLAAKKTKFIDTVLRRRTGTWSLNYNFDGKEVWKPLPKSEQKLYKGLTFKNRNIPSKTELAKASREYLRTREEFRMTKLPMIEEREEFANNNHWRKSDFRKREDVKLPFIVVGNKHGVIDRRRGSDDDDERESFNESENENSAKGVNDIRFLKLEEVLVPMTTKKRRGSGFVAESSSGTPSRRHSVATDVMSRRNSVAAIGFNRRSSFAPEAISRHSSIATGYGSQRNSVTIGNGLHGNFASLNLFGFSIF